MMSVGMVASLGAAAICPLGGGFVHGRLSMRTEAQRQADRGINAFTSAPFISDFRFILLPMFNSTFS
jgi:hypothetical protein